MSQTQNAQESIRAIQDVIAQAKLKYQQNGTWFMMWGILIAIAGISQYILITKGYESESWYPWALTMIPGYIINFIVEMKKGKDNRQSGKKSDPMGFIWLMAGTMAILTGFVFGQDFGRGFLVMIYAPFIIAAMATGLYLRERIMIIMAIMAMVIAYASLRIDFVYSPLIAALIGIILLFIPGFYLNKQYKSNHAV